MINKNFSASSIVVIVLLSVSKKGFIVTHLCVVDSQLDITITRVEFLPSSIQTWL